MKRNNQIDFLRFFFAIVIVIHHSYQIFGYRKYMPLGYLGVEFFFIISGYYMMKKLDSINKKQNIFETTKEIVFNKYKKIFLVLLFSILCSTTVLLITKLNININIIDSYIYGLSELFLLQIFGFPGIWATGATWFLSAMMISYCILIPIVLKYKKAYLNVIAFLIILGSFGLFYRSDGTIGMNIMHFYDYTAKGLLRALSDISIGMLIYHYSKNYISQKVSKTKLIKLFFTIIELLSFSGIVYIMIIKTPGYYEFVAIILLVIFLTIVINKLSYINDLLNVKLFKYLGVISIPLFLNNYYWARFYFYHKFDADLYTMIVYIITCIIASIIIYILTIIVKKVFTSINNKYIKKGEETYEKA